METRLLALQTPVPVTTCTNGSSTIPEPCAFNQPNIAPGQNGIQTTLDLLWGRFFDAAYLILGALAIGMLIYAGIQYIQASGKSVDLAKKARQNLISVLLGVLLLITSYFIIGLLGGFFGSIAKNV